MRKLVVLAILAVVASVLMLALNGGGGTSTVADTIATITTDQTKYSLGETMTITGAGFTADGPVDVTVLRPDQETDTLPTITADGTGGFTTAYTPPYIPGRYKITATDGTNTAKTAATEADAANPSVKIEQCQNGAVGATPERCVNNNWVTGNVNGSKAHWLEGDSLPYRAILKDLNTGVNTVTFSFDTAKNSELRHAIDYIASYDYTETTGAATAEHANDIDPCSDVPGLSSCDPSNPTAVAAITVPAANTSGYPAACALGTFTGSPLAGQQIKAWSASPTGVSAMTVTYPPPEVDTGSTDCPTKFKVTFTVDSGTSTVVIAWGGHVAANGPITVGGYWGTGNAVPTGSPYHMHAGFPQESPVGTFFNVGNQDLALASSAIVQPETPTVTTAVHLGDDHTTDIQNTSIALGSTVHDSATVAATPTYGTPTGSVVFTFYTAASSCTGASVGAGTVPLNASGVADPSNSEGPLAAGSYSFKAHFISGNASKWTDADSACEPLTVDKAQLEISTTIHDSSHAVVGGATHVSLNSVVHDTATVTGQADAIALPAVTFAFFPNGTCADTGTPVANSGADENVPTAQRSAASLGLAAGSYSYQATVATDSNYLGATSDCEPLTVDKKQLDISTTVHNDAGDVPLLGNLPLGGGAHDSAAVTGKVDEYTLPNVTFYFFSKGVSCTNGSTTGGTPLNTMAPDATSGIAHPSDSETNLAAGTYNFMAVVAGNDNYLGKTSNCEPLTVDKADLRIRTDIHNESHGVITGASAGSVVHDTATLSDAVVGINPDLSKISFTFYSTSDKCTGTSSSPANTGSEDTYVARSADAGPLATGPYSYTASFAGDDNYNLVGPATCEQLTIVANTSDIDTQLHEGQDDSGGVKGIALGGESATGYVHDRVRVDTYSTFAPTGTVTIRFFNNDLCTGDPSQTSSNLPLDSADATGGEVDATSFYQGPLSAGKYAFQARYNGDTNNAPTNGWSGCEPFTVSTVKVIKTESSGAPTLQYTFRLTDGAGFVPIELSTSPGNGTLDFGVLKAGDYTLCELAVPAGTNSTLEDLGGVPNPNTGDICLNFTLTAGEGKVFNIDNWRPGGGQRTIGYWKNWNKCSHDGAFEARAAKTGNTLADDLLPIIIGKLNVSTCQIAVAILDKTDVLSGEKRASDAAYALAAQLLGAELNKAALAATCPAADTAIAKAQELLDGDGTPVGDANFTGAGPYWKGGKGASANRAEALSLANTLDQYNNGTLCP